MKVTPNNVSGRVVKTGQDLLFILKGISVPSLFPIQFFCMAFILSGQSSFSISFRSSLAYLVVLINHCSNCFISTSVSECLQHLPLCTCSFARTVPHLGHQLTEAFFL